jgi:hypothetical protein
MLIPFSKRRRKLQNLNLIIWLHPHLVMTKLVLLSIYQVRGFDSKREKMQIRANLSSSKIDC